MVQCRTCLSVVVRQLLPPTTVTASYWSRCSITAAGARLRLVNARTQPPPPPRPWLPRPQPLPLQLWTPALHRRSTSDSSSMRRTLPICDILMPVAEVWFHPTQRTQHSGFPRLLEGPRFFSLKIPGPGKSWKIT